MNKNKPFIHNFSLRINWLNQPIMKLACLMQHQRKYEVKIVMEVRVLKLKCVNSTIFGSQSFCGSFMIPVTTLCIVMFAERQAQILPAKPNLLRERKSSNVFIKLWYQQKPIPQQSIFSLIQCINNYSWINTYWSCMVRIGIFINLTSNMFWRIKNVFLLARAGMNCRGLLMSTNIRGHRSLDCMVVGFTTTCAISVYHH